MKLSGLFLVGGVVVAAFILAACAGEPSVKINNAPAEQGVLVRGRGEVKVAPDTGKINIGVEVTRDTVARAREDAARAASAVIESAKGNGVAEKDMQTAGLSIYPSYKYPRDGERELVGFTVTNTVAITVRDLEAFSKIIDEAVEAGGDDVRLQGISFELEDREKAIEEARAAAMEDARSRAEQLAEAAGVRLGAPLSITEISSTSPPVFFDGAAEARSGAATPIEPGSTSIVVQVQVRWALED